MTYNANKTNKNAKRIANPEAPVFTGRKRRGTMASRNASVSERKNSASGVPHALQTLALHRRCTTLSQREQNLASSAKTIVFPHTLHIRPASCIPNAPNLTDVPKKATKSPSFREPGLPRIVQELPSLRPRCNRHLRDRRFPGLCGGG
jgi:hypothetical protein